MKKLILFAAIAIALHARAFAAEVQVIANPAIAVAEITSDEVKQIFLGDKTTIGGAAVEPVLAQSGAAHELFLKTFVGKSDQALRTHFKSLVFTGKGSMPRAFASDAEIVKYVSATKGAIGYVSAGAEMSGVKRIAIK
jgi:ABC-type phosphate transport system substrate-binding protein